MGRWTYMGAAALRPYGLQAHAPRIERVRPPPYPARIIASAKSMHPREGPSKNDVIVRSSAGTRVMCQREDVVNSCQM